MKLAHQAASERHEMSKLIRCAASVMFTLWMACSPLLAADYYVDGSNAAANDANSGTAAAPWKTISKANQTLAPGDTVYIKQGSYNTPINPARSGTASGVITYRNYGSDNVQITQTTSAIYLIAKSYINVVGIHFYNLDQFLYFEGSSHNVLAYCTFDQMRNRGTWSGSWLGRSSQYNWIHHCQFSKWGYYTAGAADFGSDLYIGDDQSTTDHSDYNLIENNTLFHGGHDVMEVAGSHNVIRNNYFHNENWYSGFG